MFRGYPIERLIDAGYGPVAAAHVGASYRRPRRSGYPSGNLLPDRGRGPHHHRGLRPRPLARSRHPGTRRHRSRRCTRVRLQLRVRDRPLIPATPRQNVANREPPADTHPQSPPVTLLSLSRDLFAAVFDEALDLVCRDERDVAGDRPLERRRRRGVLEGVRNVVTPESAGDERPREGVAGADRVDGVGLGRRGRGRRCRASRPRPPRRARTTTVVKSYCEPSLWRAGADRPRTRGRSARRGRRSRGRRSPETAS